MNPETDKPDFYMSSDDYDLFDEPRKCYSIRRFSGKFRDDYLLIRIDPPIEAGNVDGVDSEISEVIVATRHQGATLFPINEWPLHVHVLLPVVPGRQHLRVIETQIGDLYSEVWAELYPTEEDARTKNLECGKK